MFKEWYYFVCNRNSANTCCRLAFLNIKPFDITGRTEKKVTDQELTKIKQYLSKVRQDCIEHPEKYYKGNVTVSCNGLSEREDNK